MSIASRLLPEFRCKAGLVRTTCRRLESVKTASDYIAGKTDRLDLLVNDAAILGNTVATLFDALDFAEMQKVFNINALGALRVSNALISLIVNSSSKLIINISSDAGSISTCQGKGWFAYNMSKAALNMQSVIIHNNLREVGGQMLIIHPGWMKSYMRGKLDENAPMTPETSAQHIMQIILQHAKYQSATPAFIDYLGNQMPW
jgi:NAD(P)-dependent dehydrogenase (short-subunit alcohol dehydrogenase family)